MVSCERSASAVVFSRLFDNRAAGFYINIGITTSELDDPTQLLYDLGWRGITVSSDAGKLTRRAGSRSKDIHFNFAAKQVCGQPLETKFGSSFIVSDHQTVTDLASLFVHAPSIVDLLVICTEDKEGSLVASGDWTINRPRVVVARLGETDFSLFHDILARAAYHIGFDDGQVRFYCRDEDRATLLPFMQAPTDAVLGWSRIRETVTERALAISTERCCELERKLEQLSSDIGRSGVNLGALRADLSAANGEIQAAALSAADPRLARRLPSIVLERPQNGLAVSATQCIHSKLQKRFVPLGKNRLVKTIMHARSALVQSSGLFSQKWYREKYPDLATVENVLNHFVEFGSLELRNPGPSFDAAIYLHTYPDVAELRVEPFFHYLVHGRKEGRFAWRSV